MLLLISLPLVTIVSKQSGGDFAFLYNTIVFSIWVTVSWYINIVWFNNKNNNKPSIPECIKRTQFDDILESDHSLVVYAYVITSKKG